MEEIECNVVTLEDNIEYTEIGRIDYNNNTYIFLSNLDEPENFRIRKLVIENNYELLYNIGNTTELLKKENLYGRKGITEK